MRRFDRIEVLEQSWLPLRCFAREESIEIVEADAFAGRPECERPHRSSFGCRGVVPFAKSCGVVAVIAEHLGERRGASRNDPRIAIEIYSALRDGARSDALMIATGQQRGAVGEQIEVVWKAL